MRFTAPIFCALAFVSIELNTCFSQVPADTASSDQQRLSEVVVEAPESKSSVLQVHPLPEVQGAKIYSGKKTTVTELETLPQIPNNNYRQAFSQSSGLLTSEVSGEGIASFSYRGLGDPHESFNVNLLKDGVSIAADMYGYPANYYQPPLDSVQSIEFLRGGSGLLYGPQVGGAINFVPRAPSASPYAAVTKQIFGTNNFYSTYNELSGTQGEVSYIGFLHHRESDGMREENSDYQVNNGAMSVFYTPDTNSRWSTNIDIYDGSHGEAGGLTLDSGEGLASYDENRFQTVTKFDRLEIQRYFATVGYAHNFDSKTSFEGKLYGGYYNRFSRRQSAGTAATFGGVYNGETNVIVDQEFQTTGFDGRVKHNYDLGGVQQTLTAGLTLFGAISPFTQQEGAHPYSNAGLTLKDLNRYTGAGALFVENRFVFGNLRLTPGVRLENIYQKVDEKLSPKTAAPLRDRDDFVTVPLFGFGASYDLGSSSEIYANASQSYKPTTYQDTIPLNTGDTISNDLDPAHAVTYEAGVRGAPVSWAEFDASTFLIRFNDQFGRVGANIQNVGNSRTTGIDFSAAVDTLGLVDEITASETATKLGSLRLYGNASLLNAEFTSGPADGKTPQFAPDYLIRAGVIYDYHHQVKVALLGTFVDDLYADDGNTANRYIPGYAIWDLTAEVPVIPDVLSVVAGVNNLFDENYYSRIRSNGIDPGQPRNAYGGVTIKF